MLEMMKEINVKKNKHIQHTQNKLQGQNGHVSSIEKVSLYFVYTGDEREFFN